MDKIILNRLDSFNLSMQQKKDLVDIIKYVANYDNNSNNYPKKYENAYGIEWAKGDNRIKRIGNMELHKTCPIQNRLKGCLHDGKKILHWLNPDGWGLPMDNGEVPVLDGSMGDVGVAMPLEYFVKIIDLKDKYQIWISDENIDGDWIRISPCIYSPTCALTRINSAGKEEAFNACIKKDDESHIGGDKDENNKENLHGKPRIITSLNQAIEFCKNRNNGIKIIDYLHYAALQLLFYIEYATFNFKEPVNKELTKEGFKQGGLGMGISNYHYTINEYFTKPILYTYFCIESNVGNKNFCDKELVVNYKDKVYNFTTKFKPCYFHGIHFIGDISILIGDLMYINDITISQSFKLYRLKNNININNINIDDFNINNIEEIYDYINTFGVNGYKMEFDLSKGLYFFPNKESDSYNYKYKYIYSIGIDDYSLISPIAIYQEEYMIAISSIYGVSSCGFMTIVDLD